DRGRHERTQSKNSIAPLGTLPSACSSDSRHSPDPTATDGTASLWCADDLAGKRHFEKPVIHRVGNVENVVLVDRDPNSMCQLAGTAQSAEQTAGLTVRLDTIVHGVAQPKPPRLVERQVRLRVIVLPTRDGKGPNQVAVEVEDLNPAVARVR